MGPLIPNGIIDAGWSYIIAMVLGFFFGFILESAGFSSSRKLAGVFYGYDFTVLRVFFTAVVTAMIGLLYFNFMGWIDLSMLYITPTFLQASLLGGVIMGFGFVIGGFCPGTGVVGASIGKLDGLAYVGGLYLGIFIFSEAFPIEKSIYFSQNLGRVKITETLGISSGLFAFLFLLAALAAFGVASYVLKRVKKSGTYDDILNEI